MAKEDAKPMLEYLDATSRRGLEIKKFDDGGVTVVILDRRRKIRPIEIVVNLLIGLSIAVALIAFTQGIHKADVIRLMYFRPPPVAYVWLFMGFIVFLMFLGDLYRRGRTSILAISPNYVVVNVPRLLGDVKFQVPRDILTEVKLIRNERGFREPRGVVLKFKERTGIFVEPNSSDEALMVFNALMESEAATAPRSQTAAPTTAADGESPKRAASSNLAANSEEKAN